MREKAGLGRWGGQMAQTVGAGAAIVGRRNPLREVYEMGKDDLSKEEGAHKGARRQIQPNIAIRELCSRCSCGAKGKLESRSSSRSEAGHVAVAALFPILLGILPLKEFNEGRTRWYRFVRWLKFRLLWFAIIMITLGAWEFIRAIQQVF